MKLKYSYESIKEGLGGRKKSREKTKFHKLDGNYDKIEEIINAARIF